MTTALFMLRCVELGLNIADLDLLTIGSVNDMFNEKSRDSMEWKEQAAQSDFDKLKMKKVRIAAKISAN